MGREALNRTYTGREALNRRKEGITMSDTNTENTQTSEATATTEAKTQPTAEAKTEEKVSIEEQNQQLRIELAKLKKSVDKASSEAASYKKQLRAKQSEDEIAAQEKAEKEAERQAELESLKKENTVNKLVKNFIKLGYTEEMAEKAAEAQYDNDTEEIFRIQSEHQALMLKQKEAEWIKSRPSIASGSGEDAEGIDPGIAAFKSVFGMK